jgi:hypothetical protein
MTPDEINKLRARLGELNRNIAECRSQVDHDHSQQWEKRLVQLMSERAAIENTLAQYT